MCTIVYRHEIPAEVGRAALAVNPRAVSSVWTPEQICAPIPCQTPDAPAAPRGGNVHLGYTPEEQIADVSEGNDVAVGLALARLVEEHDAKGV